VSKGFMAAFCAAALLVAAPVLAQSHSDGYTFLKAVKDRDGATVSSLIATPGTIVINTRDRSNGEGALHLLVRQRDLTWLAFLLGKKAKPDLQNNQGETPLNLAAQIGWIDGAEVLLSQRATVNLGNNRGETPLIRAVQMRDIAMVRLLLSKGADPKRPDAVAGYSAIDYARQDSRAAPILKLLEAAAAPRKPAAGPKL
jgi:ankyrin repeat protein